jgi:prevent-host-death family protein
MGRSENGPASSLLVSEDIVPIGELKAHLSERIRELRDRRRPLVITQSGRAAAVLLAPEDFDRLIARAGFVTAVQEGLAELDAGSVVTNQDLGRRLDARFGPVTKRKT